MREYFCYDCGQLRLDLRKKTLYCGYCGSPDIKVGKPGALDKDALKKEFEEGKKND